MPKHRPKCSGTDERDNRLAQQRPRRGIFREVEDLIMAIGDYIDNHNDNPQPFVWRAKAADILEKVKRAHATLDNA